MEALITIVIWIFATVCVCAVLEDDYPRGLPIRVLVKTAVLIGILFTIIYFMAIK